MTQTIPAGFEMLDDDGRCFDMIGPVYTKRETPDSDLIFGLPAERRHCNRRDVVQGGILVMLADHTLALACWRAADDSPCATISINTDFIGPARAGDWIEARAEVTKITRSLVFGSSQVFANDKLILSANGVWKRLGTG